MRHTIREIRFQNLARECLVETVERSLLLIIPATINHHSLFFLKAQTREEKQKITHESFAFAWSQ
jgi:hypothetical protein